MIRLIKMKQQFVNRISELDFLEDLFILLFFQDPNLSIFGN